MPRDAARDAPVATARYTLEFDVGATPISGRLQAPGSRPRPFEGWLELMVVLQAVLASEAEA